MNFVKLRFQIEKLLASKEDLNCSACFPVEGRSIVDYYENLRIFLLSRAELWVELIRFSVVDKLLSPGRLIIVSLPETERIAAVAVLLKVYKYFIESIKIFVLK